MSPDTSVGDINVLAARREGDAIGHGKPIRSNSYQTTFVVIPVHLVLQPRSRAEVVGLAIGRIGEIHVEVLGVNRKIVERVELPAKIVVQDHRHVIRLNGVHDKEPGGDLGTLSLCCKEDLPLVLDGAVGVGNLRGCWDLGDLDLADGIAGVLDGFGLFESNLEDGGGLVQACAGVWGTGVLDKENLVLAFVPNYRLVEDGVLWGLGDDGEGWLGADDAEKLVVVDVEGLL